MRKPCLPQGLIEETRALLARYGRQPALDSLGYRQAGQYLDGALTIEQAIAAASQGHRNYAKRQLTWFRREPEVSWLNGFGDDLSIQTEAESLVAQRTVPGKCVTRCAFPRYNGSLSQQHGRAVSSRRGRTLE